ncbi:penicillin-binding protein 1A [Brevirhabdus sp.]|uniref:penicillin-binding protein 1A n=1 Tax=Brevirhabdus sp. TaxID=2004514 RepID=UPI004057FC6B
MIRAIFAFIGGIFSWVTNGAIMVALGISAIFWMYGRDLPNHAQLAQYAPPTISRIYSGEGRLMDEFARERRIFTPSEDIPDLVKQAFISAEDKNFYSHRGYDPVGMASAALDAARGRRLRGASTITQQVMKNFLLSADRSAERKIKELILASRLEKTLSKEKILELYLNEIFLGQNSYGVAAAAQTYFNKTLGELTAAEAAYLAALPKAPSTYHPVRGKERATERRNFVLREMFQNGYIDEQTYQTSKATPLMTVQDGLIADFREALPPRDYFTDEIRRQLSGRFGEEEFFEGGLSIRATVDPVLQSEAAVALREGLEKYDRNLGVWRGVEDKIAKDKLKTEDDWRAALKAAKVPRDIAGWYPAVVLEDAGDRVRIGIEGVADDADGQWLPASDVTWARPRQADGRLGPKAKKPGDLVAVGDVVLVKAIKNGDTFERWSLRQVPRIQGGFMAMDVNTGRVLAMRGGFSYQDSVFNRATQATRQPGSVFKPFVYASALDSGYTPATLVLDAPIEVDVGGGKVWRPKNASNKYFGPAPLRTGIERSRNLMTVRLAQEVGMDTVAAYAERFGVYDRLDPYLSNALGSAETTLFKLVAAYAMFANGGERVEPTLVDRVQDRWGKTIYRHDQRQCVDCSQPGLPPGKAPTIYSDRQRVMDPITAYQLTSMMRGVVERGTASRTVKLPIPIAGKTGTTNDAKDVWFIGFSTNIVAGCFIGYDQPRGLGRGASGGGMCGPVFTTFMKKAIPLYGGGEFKVPDGGVFVNIDRYSGERVSDNASGKDVVAELFRIGEEPLYGSMSIVDGGFGASDNLPVFSRGESDDNLNSITTSTGQKKKIAPKASFGALSSGGLY